MITRNLIYLIALIVVVTISVAMKEPFSGGWKEEDHSKLIKFTHTFHVKDQGVGCEDCHHAAKASEVSSDNLIGDHESCKSCHEDQLANKCGFCHIDPENIVPIKNPEREIKFSHKLHADKHNVKCELCHAGVDEVTYATSANMPKMTVCINCHNSEKISTECATCHTDFARLIPQDHLSSDFRKDHKRLTRLGEQNVSCAMCHSESFCQDCHSGIELKGFGSYKDLMADPFPRMPLKDSPRDSKLQQVHDLNYRFTHGIDVKSRRLDCLSCHERQTFCVQCHEAGGNITQQKIKPENHSEAGFKTIGKGTGGGRHAELAKQDIEYCMSCHDVEGADPACMMCHTENGGVR